MQLASQSSTGAVGLNLVAGFSSAATYLYNIQKPIVFHSIDKKAVCSLLCRATSVQWACHCTDQKVVCSLLDRAALVQWTRTGSQSLVL